VKTPREIELLEQATAIGESAARQTAASAGPATTPSEMVDRFRLFAAEAGADLDHVAVSLDGLAFSTGGERHLGEGSTMFYDYGCTYHGWLSDSGTTLCVGEPLAEALAGHEVVRRAVVAGSELLRPGIRGSFVQAAMQAVLTQEGIAETVPQGHGIGLEIREHPILVAGEGGRLRDDCLDMNADLPLEEHMVLNLEATVHFLGQRSVHCEQSFVITGDGSRLLTAQSRDAPFVTGASSVSTDTSGPIVARSG
jgi:Xaa-Pro aminopeptidase